MRVGFFLHPLRIAAGQARYVRGLIRGLLEIDDGVHEYVVFRHPADHTYRLPSLPANWTVVPTRVAAERIPLRIGAEHLLLAGLLKRHGVELFHGLNNVVPLRCPAEAVVTIHDLSVFRFPALHTVVKRRYWQWSMRYAARTAAAAIAVSESTAADMRRFLGPQLEEIVVAPHGAPEPGPAADAAVLERWGLTPGRFILFVGTLEPRKNVETLVRAFGMLCDRLDGELKLVLAGERGWHVDRVEAALALSPWRGRIVETGFVADDVLRRLYRDAGAFVYPSVFEGFGLPVLEALAAGAPTVTSNVSSLPEVAGDAALLVDPRSATDIAAAVETILNDPRKAEELRDRGRARARQFTWERTASITRGVYDALAR